MLSKFVNRTPTSLDAIYGIDSARSRADMIDLGDIKLVHDVSREATLAQGFYAEFQQTLVTAGAGVRVFDAQALESVVASTGAPGAQNAMASRNLSFDEIDFWVLGIAFSIAAADSGNFGAGASAACGYETGAFATTQVPLFLLSGADSVEQTIGAGGRLHLGRFTEIAHPFGPRRYPFRIPTGSRLMAGLQDDAAGAITSGQFNWSLWIGPKDTAPIL